MPRRKQTEDNDGNLSTQDWLDIARETLIREGIEAVKIDRLAKANGVTRGGFYWRFKSRKDLLDQLLEDWRSTNTGPYMAVVNGPGTPRERFQTLMRLWLEEREFRPDYDIAVRNWALSNPKVAEVVHTIDSVRVDALRHLFADAGYEGDEALVRARITYYHQVGYYTLGIKQSAERRRQLIPLYYKILSGFPDTPELEKRGKPAKPVQAE